jgi:hypothetical protein
MVDLTLARGKKTINMVLEFNLTLSNRRNNKESGKMVEELSGSEKLSRPLALLILLEVVSKTLDKLTNR